MVPAPGAVRRRPSPWWFRLAVAAAAAPLLAAVVVTAAVFQDDELVHGTTGVPATTVLRAQDRWQAVQTSGQAGWPAVLTAVACLVLALAVVRGRPGRLAPPEGRGVLTWLAVGCGAWALGTAALTSWVQVTGPLGWDGALGGAGLPLTQWVVDTGQALFAAAVAVAVVAWCRRPASDERVVEDAGERARAQ